MKVRVEYIYTQVIMVKVESMDIHVPTNIVPTDCHAQTCVRRWCRSKTWNTEEVVA